METVKAPQKRKAVEDHHCRSLRATRCPARIQKPWPRPVPTTGGPESAAGGGLAWLRTGDTIRIDLNTGRCDMLVADDELAARKAGDLPPIPEAATPWQKLYRETVTQMADGATIRDAEQFRQLAKRLPRHNH